MNGIGLKNLEQALRALVEASVDTGVADATSTVNYLDDSAKSWPIDAFKDLIVEITAGTGEGQIRKIDSNTATRITPVTAFTTAPDATSQYRIGFFGKMTGDITDRAARLLGIVYGNVDQLQQTTAKNLKDSIEEQAIALGIDVQARYPLRTIRTIATPAIDTDYFLPETGSIDLSNFIHSSWFAYAPTTATMTIDACELQVSLDGGTTFRKASGYEIADADFQRDEWNSVDAPLMLAQARFRIRFGTAAPASAELAVVRKA